jgi:hypothetical protein
MNCKGFVEWKVAVEAVRIVLSEGGKRFQLGGPTAAFFQSYLPKRLAVSRGQKYCHTNGLPAAAEISAPR